MGQRMVMGCERAVYPDEFYTVFLSNYLSVLSAGPYVKKLAVITLHFCC